nr:restriction endonuclease subunit S [Enterococcus faecalis]
MRKENAGGTQKFLSLSKIRDFKFLTPVIDEQQKIETFFNQLDDTITLHQYNDSSSVFSYSLHTLSFLSSLL